MKKYFIPAIALLAVTACGPKYQVQEKEGYNLVTQKGGPTLGYSPASGVQLLEDKGFAFKDLNQNGQLDVYEDWRKSPEERAKDLASQLSIDEIAGLMLYSSHQRVPSEELTEAQQKFLKEDNLRAVLITSVKDTRTAVIWNNNMQAFTESVGHGVPSNTSSDPRNQASADMEFNAGAGGDISLWPSSLGLAATFDPALVEEFGRIASAEYRALGIATALSPQIDIATEPRWWRFSGTFGEDPNLTTDMARAYCDGFQTSPKDKRLNGAWGWESVNAMAKHWYGYGAEEAGRDGHFGHGKFCVYPGDNLKMHKQAFVEGAFHLNGGTGSATAIMPVYSILWNQAPDSSNVGGTYSDFVIRQELREGAGFDGVVCTDWNVTYDCTSMDTNGNGKPWGVEDLSVAERHYRAILVGTDQFGGNNDKVPVLEAYQMFVDNFGEQAARERFEKSAYRLTLNSFRTGLFENPYLDPAESEAIVGCPEFMAKGYEAQLKSVVMLKNHENALPVAQKAKVYLPKRYYPSTKAIFFGGMSQDKWDWMIKPESVSPYYEVVENPEEADFALVAIKQPATQMGYEQSDIDKGGNGYVPITLQYDTYTATDAREQSIAGGDPLESFTNRSYKGKTVQAKNREDMVLVQETKKAMGDKPVVVVLETGNPVVLSEIEPYADAILVSFEVQNQALMELICGNSEPSALLPMQMPANMSTVEKQFEDKPFDMECYKDADGNVYDFAFGLNWSGVINDARTQKYARK
jgi:beta-glucosidase